MIFFKLNIKLCGLLVVGGYLAYLDCISKLLKLSFCLKGNILISVKGSQFLLIYCHFLDKINLHVHSLYPNINKGVTVLMTGDLLLPKSA